MIDPRLPLIDLHRHLDGSVRLETILDLGLKHNLPLPARDLEGLRPYVQVTEPQPGVMAFIEKFHWMTAILVDYDACRRVAYENVLDLRAEGIDYAELRFSPWFMALANQLDPHGVIEAVIDGIKAGCQEADVRVNLIGILSRTYGPETAQIELNALLTYRDAFVAVDLAGDEANWPGTLFHEHFKKVRDNGLHVTIHAGEADGAESVWQAVLDLGAERIGHAVQAVQDEHLMDYMARHQIGIEANLTSNVQTSTVARYDLHPLKIFLEHGILASINSDDPGISAIDLVYEYCVAAPAAGLTRDQISVAQENALLTAFLPAEEKAILKEKRSRLS